MAPKIRAAITGSNNIGTDLSHAGVYSSFLRHANKASVDHGIDARAILVELGRRRMVGGQDDTIVDLAFDLVAEAGNR